MVTGGALRRIEILLWFLGACLLGVAFASTWSRWSYQLRQERALAERGSVPMPAFALDGPAAIENRDELLRDPSPAFETIGPTAEATSVEAVPAVTDVPVTAKRVAPFPSDALGRIEIPRLRLSAIVREGSDDRTLTRAVGFIPESAPPGTIGNTVLAGHRDTFFRSLQRIQPEDRIRLVVPPETYEYRVESIRVVSPEETSVLESRGVEELTLVTCYPFRFVGPAPERFIVSAVRVN